MELFILIVVLVILAETSFLVARNYLPKRSSKRKIYVDTSALIDGRILDIARTGFIDGDLIILRSVLRELQLLADGKDNFKRSRARVGLDNVAELERVIEVNTEIYDDGEGRKTVDEELLKFAKANKGAVLTIDYNLVKVAEADNIDVLNVNDLAMAIRTEFAIGKKAKIRITEKGSSRGQGVGHLSDGTMVVVEKAAKKIDKMVTVEFVKLHETSSGKIIFAKLA